MGKQGVRRAGASGSGRDVELFELIAMDHDEAHDVQSEYRDVGVAQTLRGPLMEVFDPEKWKQHFWHVTEMSVDPAAMPETGDGGQVFETGRPDCQQCAFGTACHDI